MRVRAAELPDEDVRETGARQRSAAQIDGLVELTAERNVAAAVARQAEDDLRRVVAEHVARQMVSRRAELDEQRRVSPSGGGERATAEVHAPRQRSAEPHITPDVGRDAEERC